MKGLAPPYSSDDSLAAAMAMAEETGSWGWQSREGFVVRISKAWENVRLAPSPFTLPILRYPRRPLPLPILGALFGSWSPEPEEVDEEEQSEEEDEDGDEEEDRGDPEDDFDLEDDGDGPEDDDEADVEEVNPSKSAPWEPRQRLKGCLSLIGYLVSQQKRYSDILFDPRFAAWSVLSGFYPVPISTVSIDTGSGWAMRTGGPLPSAITTPGGSFPRLWKAR
jgi:hypothetical protein